MPAFLIYDNQYPLHSLEGARGNIFFNEKSIVNTHALSIYPYKILQPENYPRINIEFSDLVYHEGQHQGLI